MSERLYGGKRKSLDELEYHALRCAQTPGSVMDVQLSLINRIRELETAIDNIVNGTIDEILDIGRKALRCNSE